MATGGTHVPAATEDEASRRLDAVVRQGYGMTEATCIVAAPQREPSTSGTAGWLAADTEARLVDPETGRDQPEGVASSGSADLRSWMAITARQRRPQPR